MDGPVVEGMAVIVVAGRIQCGLGHLVHFPVTPLSQYGEVRDVGAQTEGDVLWGVPWAFSEFQQEVLHEVLAPQG